jgi:hypothetical protein
VDVALQHLHMPVSDVVQRALSIHEPAEVRPSTSGGFDHRWQRFFAACGVIFAILTGVGLEAFWPQPPSFGLTATATAHYYAVHQTGFLIGITLITAGMAFLLAWTVQYGAMLWRLDRTCPDGGSTVVVAVTITSLLASPILLSFDLAIFSIGAFRPTSTSPDVTRALSDVAWIGSELIWPMLAAGMALGGLLMLRTRHQAGGFPAWLGYYSLVAAAIELFQIPIIFVKTGPFSASGAFAWYSTTGSWGVWAIALSAVMWRALGTRGDLTTPSRTS